MRAAQSRIVPLWLYRVSGHSMLPGYQPGDTLVGWCWFWPARLRTGQIVVARQAGRPVVKRLAGRQAGGWDVRGDNPVVSTDSRQLGPVPSKDVLAVVILKLP